MNQTNNFKKFEKKLLIGTLNLFSLIKRILLSFFKFFLKVGNQKITIMFIPHSEKKVFNFRLNVFLLITLLCIGFGTVGVIVYLTVDNYNTSVKYREVSIKTQLNEKKSKQFEEMLSEIQDMHKIFKNKLNNLLGRINSPTIKAMQEADANNAQGGPQNAVDLTEVTEFDTEKMEFNNLLRDYQYAIQALGELNKKTDDYNKILKDLPFGSPVNGFYTVTCGFGLRIHPITKVLDNHTGVDLAYQPGTPIVSTAPGIVEKVEWNPGGYGWYLKIYHKLGFSTLYAHLRSQPIVSPGEKVKKGQIIGYMGSTGASTGTHVHYEVRLGNSLKDPWDFINNY